MFWLSRVRLSVAAGLSVTLLAAVCSPAVTAASESPASDRATVAKCDIANGEHAESPATPTRRAITLTLPEGQTAPTRNVDSDRDLEVIRVPLEANRTMPRSWEPKHFEMYADPMLRTGGEEDARETVAFPEPYFAEAGIFQNRRRLVVVACFNPAGLSEAGRYEGMLRVSGPPNLVRADIPVTINLKESFPIGFALLAAAAAAGALLLTGMRDKRAELAVPAADQTPRYLPWRAVLGPTLKDLQWWVSSVVALATAAAAVVAIYNDDPTWGSSGISAEFAIVAAAFGAVGGQTLLAGLRQATVRAG